MKGEKFGYSTVQQKTTLRYHKNTPIDWITIANISKYYQAKHSFTLASVTDMNTVLYCRYLPNSNNVW
jgi:hypothetical protein